MMRIKLFKYKANKFDMELDKIHYDEAAKLQANLSDEELKVQVATNGIQKFQKVVFDYYYECIGKNINSKMDVLELGAGMGRHSGVILDTGANLTVNDISASSLDVLKRTYPDIKNVVVSSMDQVPIESKSYDVIVSCGSLSYADPNILDREIFRLLRNGGSLIILDSLNHNPIYKLNRVFKYFIKRRSKSSVKRIPDLDRIDRLSKYFNKSDIKFFGTYFWMITILGFFIGQDLANKTNILLEKYFPSSKNAFKFVLVCNEFNGHQE
jgi:SAM-dependent methyltransferase